MKKQPASFWAHGNRTSVTDALNHQTATITYDSHGKPLTVADYFSNTTRFTYDPDRGDLLTVADPLNRTVTRFPDNAGRLVAVTDANGKTTRMVYNPLNEILNTTDPSGNLTQFGYDANGNLLTVIDALNHATQHTYDNMDRLATRKDPLLNQEGYQYDVDGNLTQFTDRRGKVTSYRYDALNRRSFAGFGTQAGPTYESTINYTYDAGNRLTQAADSTTGPITRGYDNLDRLTSEAPLLGTVSYTYDSAGRRASLTVPGQAVANYTFDNANRLTQITQGSATVSFAYDNANRRTTLTLPNGITTSYSYDNASQLTGLTYANGSTTLGNLTYGYDLAGRRISVGGSYARTNLPSAVSPTAYNANNQLTTWGTAGLFYDANGNMTSDGTHSYAWDARNHLSAIDSGGTASFAYDPFGRRVSKNILATSTSFLYDGANPVQENIGGASTANSLMGGIDEVFQRTDSAGARSFLTDALGSSLALADATGTLQTTYSFDAFGNTTLAGSSTTNSFAYTGRELDASGLYFYRARYYNPQLQRFISEDPLGYAGNSVNFYEYANSNPVNFRDPFGLSGCDQVCQNQISVLQSMFPGSRVVGNDPNQPRLVIPQNADTVRQILVDQGYHDPSARGWNPFLYWDPFAHAGGEEYRIGVDTSSFHFRQKYPSCPYAEDVCLKLPPQMQFPGRKTALDQFHIDDHDPRVDPKGHLLHDVLHLPDYFDYLPYSPF
jgi:RHS repeat-associated protein